MKRNLFLLLLLLPATLIAQKQTIDSFYEIPIASSREFVLNTLKQRGAALVAGRSTENGLVVNQLSLGPRTFDEASFLFNENSLYQVKSVLIPSENSSALELFNAIKSEIDTKYGAGKVAKNFQPPYKDGDGTELIALRRGYATINAEWTSELANNHKTRIVLSISKEMKVLLNVEDESVYLDLLNKRKRTVKN